MAFNALINSIAPVPTPSDWVRPSDWIAITDTPNEVQFLVCDIGSKAFSIKHDFTRTSGNIYIDWGDGTIDTITIDVPQTTSHVYSTGGTPCSRGYNTWKIRIYGDPTCVITNAQHIANRNVSGGFYNIGLLEAYFGDGTCNTSGFNSYYFTSLSTTLSSGSFQYLEYVKLPSTVSWTTQLSQMFQNCANLYKIVMPTSAIALTNTSNMANGCINLRDIALPSNATAITTLASAFTNCINLRTVSFPTDLNSCISFNSTFGNCTSLKNVTFPSINLCTSFNSLFQTCRSLQWVRFTSLPSPVSPGTSISFIGVFGGCSQLQNVYFPSSCSSNARYDASSAFSSCNALKNLLFPTGFDANSLQSTFSTCQFLTSVVFQSGMPSLINMSFTFNSCSLLNSVTLPPTVGASISLQNIFTSCSSLKSITIPSAWTISSLSQAFANCNNLTSITLPNNAQNSCTTMDLMCQGCNKLETIVMPTSLNSINTLSSAFNNCYRLTSVTFPSAMNSVNSLNGVFQSCYNLTSVTMPTIMSVCTSMSSVFSSCYSLETLTLPATLSPSFNSYGYTFFQCVNLKTLTLPTTQTSNTNNITQMLYGCSNLTTINNLNKLGSLTATPTVNAAIAQSAEIGSYMNSMTSLSFSCPFSQLTLNGSNTTSNFNRLNSLRLLNTGAGQWAGSSPQINVSYCDLGIAALNQLFTDLTTITSKTINITGCTGAAGCTRSIATAKGWTVTG